MWPGRRMAGSAERAELLTIILDARLAQLTNATPIGDTGPESDNAAFPAIWDAVSVLIAAHAALALDQQVALFAAHAGKAIQIAGGVCGDVDLAAGRVALCNFIVEETAAQGTPLVAAALSLALCYTNRVRRAHKELGTRILVIECSHGETDFAAHSAALVNCAFAAQAGGTPLDCLSLGQEPSVLLRQAAILSKGKHHALALTGAGCCPHAIGDVLAPLLLFHFLPGVAVREELHATRDVQNLPAICSCHGEVREIAYVCSACLAVCCSNDRAFCLVCKTRFKPDRVAERRIAD